MSLTLVVSYVGLWAFHRSRREGFGIAAFLSRNSGNFQVTGVRGIRGLSAISLSLYGQRMGVVAWDGKEGSPFVSSCRPPALQ